MKSLFARFKRKPKLKSLGPDSDIRCRVLLINDPNNGYLHHTLGITDKRMEELVEILRRITAMHGKKGPSTIISEFSKEMKHPNELAYMCYHFGYCNNSSHVPLNFISPTSKF